MKNRTAVWLALISPILAQSPPAAPKFEVASVKPSGSSGNSSGPQVTPGRFNVDNLPLRRLMQMAYAVMDFQISGDPEWIIVQIDVPPLCSACQDALRRLREVEPHL
jgi:hypothetical protein